MHAILPGMPAPWVHASEQTNVAQEPERCQHHRRGQKPAHQDLNTVMPTLQGLFQVSGMQIPERSPGHRHASMLL